MKEQIKHIWKSVSEHSGLISVIFAVVSFLFAYLQALIFTNGQIEITNFIIQEVGIIPMWIGAVVTLTNAMLQTGILLLLISTKGDVASKTGWVTSIAIFTMLWWVIPLMFIVVIIATLLFIYIQKRRLAKMDHKDLSTYKNNYIFIVVTSLLLLGISNFPRYPSSIIVLNDDSKSVVTKIANKDKYILVSEGRAKKLKQIRQEDIKSETLCQKKQSFLSYSLNDNLMPENRTLPTCPDIDKTTPKKSKESKLPLS